MEKTFKLAGVTFNNEDGTPRQDILRVLYELPGHVTIVKLIETTYDGERAVKVIDEKSGQTIGWIRKADLFIMNKFPEKMTARIDFYKDNYFVVLEEYKTPSQKLYHAVKELCDKKHIQRPMYEMNAYRWVLNNK